MGRAVPYGVYDLAANFGWVSVGVDHDTAAFAVNSIREELAEFSFQGFRDRVIRLSGKKNPTVRDFISISGRGTVKEHPMFCGSPKQVADQMEEWFTAPACDGFVLAASSMPGAYDDVVRLLVPELQRRGLFRKEYAGPTLRENLGLPIPLAADWHAARRRASE